ncbi:hypothetical protein DL771_001900 [Monosporascus sp. 5C6A]|nr:hypothetical protein DL771_001900 [Monosporascus sp. 5C6A]
MVKAPVLCLPFRDNAAVRYGKSSGLYHTTSRMAISMRNAGLPVPLECQTLYRRIAKWPLDSAASTRGVSGFFLVIHRVPPLTIPPQQQCSIVVAAILPPSTTPPCLSLVTDGTVGSGPPCAHSCFLSCRARYT